MSSQGRTGGTSTSARRSLLSTPARICLAKEGEVLTSGHLLTTFTLHRMSDALYHAAINRRASKNSATIEIQFRNYMLLKMQMRANEEPCQEVSPLSFGVLFPHLTKPCIHRRLFQGCDRHPTRLELTNRCTPQAVVHTPVPSLPAIAWDARSRHKNCLSALPIPFSFSCYPMKYKTRM